MQECTDQEKDHFWKYLIGYFFITIVDDIVWESQK